MTLATAPYIHKPDPVTAVQVTRENYEEVAAWCGGFPVSISKASDPTDVYVGIDILAMGGMRRVNVSDYVIKNETTGRFSLMTEETFRRTFDKVVISV